MTTSVLFGDNVFACLVLGADVYPRPGTARSNSSNHLASIYGGTHSRRINSTCSSPVPWDGGQSPGGGATPDILTVETSPLQQPGRQEEAAGVFAQQDEALQTDAAPLDLARVKSIKEFAECGECCWRDEAWWQYPAASSNQQQHGVQDRF